MEKPRVDEHGMDAKGIIIEFSHWSSWLRIFRNNQGSGDILRAYHVPGAEPYRDLLHIPFAV